MKYKHFFKVIAIFISLVVILALVFVRTTEAQTYVTVAADHDLDIDSNFDFFSMEYRATAYFEIKFDIKAVKVGGGHKDVEVILKAKGTEGDIEVEDNNTVIYYLGGDGDSYDSGGMSSYQDLGPGTYGDIEMMPFIAIFAAAAYKDDDWIDYEWEGSEIEKITINFVASSTFGTTASTIDLLKIKEYKFQNTYEDVHEESQDFSDSDSDTMSEADWDVIAGSVIIDTSDDTLYFRSTIQAQADAYYYEEICDGYDNDWDGIIPDNEADNDGDGFMICEGDCDDSDDTVYPGASGTYNGKDNNCNGIIDKDEKKRPSYLTYTPIFPSWTQYQQSWRLSLLPIYLEQQKQNWYHYQLNLYQQILIQTLYSGGEFWPFYAQPYWYQPYFPYWSFTNY